MSFDNNGARVKYVQNLKRAPTGYFGPSDRLGYMPGGLYDIE